MDIHAALLIGILATPTAGIKQRVSDLLAGKWLIKPIAMEAGESTVSWAKKVAIMYPGNSLELRGHQ